MCMGEQGEAGPTIEELCFSSSEGEGGSRTNALPRAIVGLTKVPTPPHPTHPTHPAQVVILSQVLACDATLGYEDQYNTQVLLQQPLPPPHPAPPRPPPSTTPATASQLVGRAPPLPCLCTALVPRSHLSHSPSGPLPCT